MPALPSSQWGNVMTKKPQFLLNVDAKLVVIDKQRKRLTENYERALAKLDAKERELLGLKPMPFGLEQ